MNYPYAFLYNGSTVPKREIAGFLKILLQYAMLAKASGSNPDKFVPHVDFRISDIESHYSKRNAVVSDIAWLTRKLSRTGS